MRRFIAVLVVSGFLWTAPLSELGFAFVEPAPIVFVVSDLRGSRDDPRRTRHRGRRKVRILA
jgi:hypothetical protein